MNLYQKTNYLINIYKQAIEKEFISHNKFALGNISVYIYNYYGNYGWVKINKELEKYLKNNKFNEFNYTIANAIKNICLLKKYENEKLIEKRMEHIEVLYNKKELNTYNILYDDYFFHENIKKAISMMENAEFYDYVKENFMKFTKNEKVSKYFSNQNLPIYEFIFKYLYYKDLYPELLYLKLDTLLNYETDPNLNKENEFLWILYKELNDIYKKELYKLNKKDENIKNFLEGINSLYSKLYLEGKMFDFSILNLEKHILYEKIILPI